jgi:hypothetical protein
VPNTEDYLEEDYVEESEELTTDPNLELKSQIASLQDQVQSLLAMNTVNKRKETKEEELTDDQWAEIAKDPRLAGKVLQAEVKKTKAQMQRESQKAFYDKQVDERFAHLVSNPEYKQKIVRKMGEMISSGEFTEDSPTLALRAAESVALTLGGNTMEAKKRSSESALDASTNSVHRKRPGTVKLDENDPRVTFGKLFNFSEDQMKRFKAQLGPREEVTRKRGKSLIK